MHTYKKNYIFLQAKRSIKISIIPLIVFWLIPIYYCFTLVLFPIFI